MALLASSDRSDNEEEAEIVRRYVGGLIVLDAFADLRAMRRAWTEKG